MASSERTGEIHCPDLMIFLGAGYSMLSWIMLLVQPIEQEHSYTANSCVEQRQERYSLANEKGESER